MPEVRSYILLGYRLPMLDGLSVSGGWQHIGRRPCNEAGGWARA
ncbi:hypothetical protein [Massilia sp. 9096]|nr:hypothetical protein [Massilia sp. 9096]